MKYEGDNKYYGPGIRENQYALCWLKLFKKRTEEDVDLLMSIVLTDSINEEDKVIGCQILVNIICERKLWVSEQLVSELIEIISSNVSRIQEWFLQGVTFKEGGNYPSSWDDLRRSAILDCIKKIAGYRRITSRPNPSLDVYTAIAKQLAYGIEKEEALTAVFDALKGIAKSKYGLSPQISLPQEVIDIVEDVCKGLYEWAGDDLMKQTMITTWTQKLWRISHKKKWSV